MSVLSSLGSIGRRLRETAGPTVLSIAGIADGEYLKRSGSMVVSGVPSGSGGVTVNGTTTPPRPSYVQGNAATGIGPLAFLANVASGSLVVVVVTRDGGTVTGLTISDTLSTSYSEIVAHASSSNRIALYAGVTTAAGANTVTITGTTANFSCIGIMEFAGYSATADATASAYNSASPSTVAVTTTVAGCLIVVAQAGYHNLNTFTANSPTFLLKQVNGTDALMVGCRFVGAAAAYTESVNIAGAGTDNAPILVAAFPQDTPSGNNGEFHFYDNTYMMYGPRRSQGGEPIWGLPSSALPLP